ncbi:hypothetical protein RA269_29705, partial [Pseudomonas syringae pv. tagetis]
LGSASPATATVAKMAAVPIAVPQPTAFKRLCLLAVLLLCVVFLGWMAFSTMRAAKRYNWRPAMFGSPDI